MAASKISGKHAIEASKAFRAKLESIQEGTLPILEELNARIDRLARSEPPPVDPRREEQGEVPVDVVALPDEAETVRQLPDDEVESDPFPSKKEA